MRKYQDEQGYISWSDVGQLWRDTEREYGVHLKMDGRWSYTRRRDLGIYLSIAACEVSGGAERKILCSEGFIFPDPEYRTVPGACVGAIHRLCGALERIRREHNAIVQKAFLPADA
jgi:hypothetical protein